MKKIADLVRNNIRQLAPYSSARDEYHGKEGIFLDANENPFGSYNRYPDPYQKTLKNAIAEKMHVSPNHIFLGNGSDEVIDLIFRVFCQPRQDKALTFSPTYGMYEVSANINEVEMVQVTLTSDFQIDFDALEIALKNNPEIKVIFVCSPNNPTGNILHHIEKVFAIFDGIVVVDEAYVDFSDTSSWVTKINIFNRLIVSRTLSKARGLAGIRIGVAITNPEILGWLNKVKPPYNISEINQKYALEALENETAFNRNIQTILEERKLLVQALELLPKVKKVYPTDANFILIEVEDADATYNLLTERRIIVRNRNKQIKNTLRITVGSPEENKKLIEALQKLLN